MDKQVFCDLLNLWLQKKINLFQVPFFIIETTLSLQKLKDTQSLFNAYGIFQAS